MIGWWLNRRAARRSEDELSVWCELDPDGWTAASVVAARLVKVQPPRRTYAALERIEARGWAVATLNATPVERRLYRAVVRR